MREPVHFGSCSHKGAEEIDPSSQKKEKCNEYIQD